MDDDHLKLVLRPRQRKKGNLKQTLGDDHFVLQFIPLTVSFRQRLHVSMGNVTSDYKQLQLKEPEKKTPLQFALCNLPTTYSMSFSTATPALLLLLAILATILHVLVMGSKHSTVFRCALPS